MTRGAPPIRHAGSRDLEWMLALNRVHEEALSPLSRDELAHLVDAAKLAFVADTALGFVVCFDQTADYDSPNFNWFRERYDRFLYVDRIAVDTGQRVRGVGSALYDRIITETTRLRYPLICAEINTRPPNPVSLAFHERQGFKTVGEADLPMRRKTVCYMTRSLTA